MFAKCQISNFTKLDHMGVQKLLHNLQQCSLSKSSSSSGPITEEKICKLLKSNSANYHNLQISNLNLV